MKITIVGIGYVGISLAVLISEKHKVIAYDIDSKKIDLLNKKISTIKDIDVQEFLDHKKLDLLATSTQSIAFKDSDYIIISTSTDYNEITGSFDTSSVKIQYLMQF